MHSEEISLWLPRPQYDALERILTECGTSIETVMQARLMELYLQTVPEQERVDINNQMEGERLAAERREAELRRFSVFRITENGSTVRLECENAFEFMQAANLTRRYLRQEMDPQPNAFAEYFLRSGTLIGEERFSELVGARIEGIGNITGLCDIDIDNGIFHTARHLNGWASFHLKDVTTAAYHAYRKEYRTVDERWKIFLDHLDGRQITEFTPAKGPQRLSKDDISFSAEIMEMDGKLNFYMDSIFNVDRMFGTHVETSENDDWLNIYANFDTAQRKVCDALDIVVNHADGSCEELTYQLDHHEKDILLEKMNAYCLEREGLTLESYCDNLQAEADLIADQNTMHQL